MLQQKRDKTATSAGAMFESSPIHGEPLSTCQDARKWLPKHRKGIRDTRAENLGDEERHLPFLDAAPPRNTA